MALRQKYRKKCLFLLLCCLIVTCRFVSPVLASDEAYVSVAVENARNSGVPEDMISQMLAFGYKYNVKASDMANFINIAREAGEENLPIAPLVSKIEEGLAKRIQGGIVGRVLRQQLSQCRFARRAAHRAINRWGVPLKNLKSGELVRLSKTLSMGISRQEMEGFFARVPQAPMAEIVNALELIAALKQAHLQMKISEEIVFNGLKKGFFSKTAWKLPLMVNSAKSKKVPDKKIKAAAIDVVSGKKSVLRAHTELGLDPKDLARGPQFSHPSVSKGKGTESGARNSGGMSGNAGGSGGMGGGGGGSGGSGGGGGH